MTVCGVKGILRLMQSWHSDCLLGCWVRQSVMNYLYRVSSGECDSDSSTLIRQSAMFALLLRQRDS